MMLNKTVFASAALALLMFAPTVLADHTSGHNISTNVDGQVSTWVPLIITLVFLGLGLGVLFAAVNKMKGGK